MSAPLTKTQLPLEAILDANGKQTYLGNTYVLPTSGTSLTDTTETVVALIKNPALSGASVFLFSRQLYSNNNPLIFRFYLNPTITNANSATVPKNMRSGATRVSTSLCYLAPTISANGTLTSAASTTTAGSSYNVLYVLDQGANLLVTAQQAGAGTSTAIISNVWYEI